MAIDPVELVRTIRELGYFWGPPAVAIVLIVFVLLIRWKQRYRKFSRLLINIPVAVVLAVDLVGLLLFYRYWGIPAPFDDTEIGILIAEIPGDVNRQQQNSYADAIMRLASTSDLAGMIRVRLLQRPLPSDLEQQHELALKIGRRLNAAFVIRPVPTQGAQSPWISIVDQPDFSRTDVFLERVNPLILSDLEKVEFPNKVVLLARCVLGLSFYHHRKYLEATNQFTEVLSGPDLPNGAPSRPYLQFLLGNSYWFLHDSNPSLLSNAIKSYDQALAQWPNSRYPEAWAMAMNNRGNAYSELFEGNKVQNLLEAIRSYDEALKVCTKEFRPLDWAILMVNRGSALAIVPPAIKSDGGTEALESLEQALEVLSKDRGSAWISAMVNRGNVLQDRFGKVVEATESYDGALAHLESNTGQFRPYILYNKCVALIRVKGPARVAGFEQAIPCFDDVLRLIDTKSAKSLYADAMNNRGIAYLDLPAANPTSNVLEAIRNFDQAIALRDRNQQPVKWASAMNNRGNAYWHLRDSNRQANLKEAHRSLSFALEVLTPDCCPREWATAVTNLGAVYLELVGQNGQPRVQDAIPLFQSSLKVRNREFTPDEWSTSVNNLGVAYVNSRVGNRGINLRKAISFFQDCLQVRKRESEPFAWAESMHNLGVAYSQLRGPGRAANLKKALESFDMVLQVRTRESKPFDWALSTMTRAQAACELAKIEGSAEFGEAKAALVSAVAVFQSVGSAEYANLAKSHLATTCH